MSGPCIKLRTPATWFPIETAPKDGTDVLVWDKAFVIAYYETHIPPPRWRSTDEMIPLEPTHWMPLPEPPPC